MILLFHSLQFTLKWGCSKESGENKNKYISYIYFIHIYFLYIYMYVYIHTHILVFLDSLLWPHFIHAHARTHTHTHTWLLSNTGLNCAGPLICGLFFSVNVVLQYYMICDWLNLQMQNSGCGRPTISYM